MKNSYKWLKRRHRQIESKGMDGKRWYQVSLGEKYAFINCVEVAVFIAWCSFCKCSVSSLQYEIHLKSMFCNYYCKTKKANFSQI